MKSRLELLNICNARELSPRANQSKSDLVTLLVEHDIEGRPAIADTLSNANDPDYRLRIQFADDLRDFKSRGANIIYQATLTHLSNI